MPKADWLQGTSAAFRLVIATSWLAPDWWQESQDKAIREAIEAGPDWTEYLFLIDRHRTPALSWAALSRVSGIPIPEHTKRELQKRSDACRINAVEHCMLLAQVLKHFNLAGIPVMSLKGPLFSYELYGDIGLRHSRDLDLEIAEEDLERAQTCLESKNWHPDSSFFPMTLRQWESFLQKEHEINFVHSPTGIILELHWRNDWETSAATRALWARSVVSVWQGCSIQAMSPGDMTLYLSNHGAAHAWIRAKWLGDLARAHTLGRLDWPAAWDEARRSGQENVVLAGLCLLGGLYGLPLPALPLLGNARLGRSSRLVKVPLQALRNPAGNIRASLRNGLRLVVYERLLWPRRSWLAGLSRLLYRREDFRALPLPDELFWAYAPLRPILWAWRKMRCGRTAEGRTV